MKTIKISSDYFKATTEFSKYLKTLSYINNDVELLNNYDFIKENNKQLFANIDDYKNFLIYGDVQSGKTNNLIYITQKLVEEKGYNVILFLAGTKNELMFQNQMRFDDAFKAMNENKYLVVNSSGGTKRDPKLLSASLSEDKVIIMHSIKRTKTLSELNEMFKFYSKKVKLLIIDDEADEASLAPTTKTEINKLLLLPGSKKISITASPFKNLYSNSKDYDYFYKLKSPVSYTGIDKFGSNNFVISNSSEKSERDLIVKPFLEWVVSTLENNLDKSQLLFNVFNTIDSHNKIADYLSEICVKLSNPKNVSILLEEFEISFDSRTISEFITQEIRNNIILSNSSNEEKNESNYQIIIGGLKLSRGLTFENLTHEVMINMGSKIGAGTLIQRARWLGYRSKQLDIMRIYMTDKIYDAFEEVKDLIKVTKNYQLVHKDYKQQFNDREYEGIKI